MKAVKITTANQSMLIQRFDLNDADKDDQLPVGYWLVTDFGNDEYFDTVTEETFNILFNKGEKLENDFYDISRK